MKNDTAPPLTWKNRYDRMKLHYQWTDANVAAIVGNTPGSIRTVVTNKGQSFPRWLKLAIVIFETENPLTVNL
jgi:hypothetical protein